MLAPLKLLKRYIYLSLFVILAFGILYHSYEKRKFHQNSWYITLSHSHPSFYATIYTIQSAYIIFVMWRVGTYIFVLISLLTQVHIFFDETGSRWDLFLLYISVIVVYKWQK